MTLRLASRVAMPMACAWILVAITLAIAFNARGSEQPRIVLTLTLAATVLAVTGLVLVGRTPFAGSLAVTGLLACAISLSLMSRLPLKRQFRAESPTFDLEWASDLRTHLVDAAKILPAPGRQLVPGLAVGDTSLVGAALDDEMKTVSLTHLIAVSGANCAVITAGVIAVAAALGAPRWLRAFTAAACLVAFVLVVGPAPSVIRAGVMALILLIAYSSGRPTLGVPVLGLAGALLLVVNPLWALDAGFTLSMLATAALLTLAPPLTRALSRRMPLWLAAVIAVPLSAELVCQPVIVLLSPGLPTYGILANLVATPVAPMATVTGLLAAAILPISSVVGTGLLWVCWLPASWIAVVANVTAHLPFSRLLWPGGVVGVGLSIVLSSAIVVAMTATAGRARLLGMYVVSLTLVVSLVSTIITGLWRSIGTPRDWLIAACDVGQGDALLLRAQPTSSHVMLIDTGRDETLLRTCLDQLGVKAISVLVLTHYDIDHVGAYAAVLGRVDRALVGRPVDLSEEMIVRDLENAGTLVDFGQVGIEGQLSGDGEGNLEESVLAWKLLWPVPARVGMQSGNPGSLVVRAEWVGGATEGSETSEDSGAAEGRVKPATRLSALFLGDLGEEAQRALLATVPLAPVDVVKVAHHGSADQSDALNARLRARVGLISVGDDNGYGHPTDRALSMLASTATTPFRTDEQGMLLVRVVAGNLEVWTER